MCIVITLNSKNISHFKRCVNTFFIFFIVLYTDTGVLLQVLSVNM